jgi:hypothetical protein
MISVAHRAGHLVQRAGAGQADGHQRVVHAPDGAEEADEGGRRADGRQRREAVLHVRGFLAQHAGHQRAARQWRRFVVAQGQCGNLRTHQR